MTTPTPSWVNIQDAPYNATGLRITDDTAAINSALAAVAAAGGGVLYVPPGFYSLQSGGSSGRFGAKLLIGYERNDGWGLEYDVTSISEAQNMNFSGSQLRLAYRF